MSETIEYYNRNADSIINHPSDREMEETQLDFLTHVPQNGKILDVGCGRGQDSLFFVKKNYDVQLLDASEKMLEAAKKLTGVDGELKDFMDIDAIEEYDGIWANLSLVHASSEHQVAVWEKLYRALKPGGVIYASYYYGNNFRIVDGRYFFDTCGDDISDIIKEAGSWDNIEVWMSKELVNRKLCSFTNIFALKL